MDDEPKFGMCVMGFVSPDKILANSAARPGDALVATKHIGSGVLNTAVKGGLVDQADMNDLYQEMAQLNKYAAEVGQYFDVHACTDITGFGLAGHLCEMAEGADVTAYLRYSNVPLVKDADEFARMGIIPAGTYRNQDYFSDRVNWDQSLPTEIADLMFDPQSSGGLMFAVAPDDADMLVDALRAQGLTAAHVGDFHAKEDCFVRIVQ